MVVAPTHVFISEDLSSNPAVIHCCKKIQINEMKHFKIVLLYGVSCLLTLILCIQLSFNFQVA